MHTYYMHTHTICTQTHKETNIGMNTHIGITYIICTTYTDTCAHILYAYTLHAHMNTHVQHTCKQVKA